MSSQLPEFQNHVVNEGASIHDYVIDGSKVKWYGDRIKAWERGERIAPITIDTAWTRACQASCHFCYASTQASAWENDDPTKPRKITKRVAFEFLEDAAAIGVKGVSLISDGESTVVPWYADSIEHAARLGIKIGVGSNGIALTKPVLERILPHVSYLRFNFSAGERKRYAEIMGLEQKYYDIVLQNIRYAMEIVRRDGLGCTVNMQMVLDPKDEDQIIPFGELVQQLRPTYGILKHCADTVEGLLGINYRDYEPLYEKLRRFEAMGDGELRMIAKWNRIVDGDKRQYSKCFGPGFQLQVSGNGLVAPCGFLFSQKFAAFHIGSILEKRFIDIFHSDRYMEVLNYLASDQYDPRSRCGAQCLQHLTNDWLFKYKEEGKVQLPAPTEKAPPHLEFL